MQAVQHNTNAAPKPLTVNSKRTTRPSNSPRVLTATAQGMKHWSQYKKHSPLLFEVFGTFCMIKATISLQYSIIIEPFYSPHHLRWINWFMKLFLVHFAWLKPQIYAITNNYCAICTRNDFYLPATLDAPHTMSCIIMVGLWNSTFGLFLEDH